MMDKIDRWGFLTNVEYYIKQLLKDPVGARPSEYLVQNGLGNPKLLDMLCNKGIITKLEKIKPGGRGKDQFMIQYKVNDNPGKKIKMLYDTEISKTINECEGATSCGSVGGEYSAPVFGGPIRRTLYINEKQAERLRKKILDEVTSTSSVGNISYDAPAFGDDETLNHKNMFRRNV